MTAAGQPADEWVETMSAVDFPRGLRYGTSITEPLLAAVWPLVQAMVRDAKVETLDEAIRRVALCYTSHGLEEYDTGVGAARVALDTLRREVQP